MTTGRRPDSSVSSSAPPTSWLRRCHRFRWLSELLLSQWGVGGCVAGTWTGLLSIHDSFHGRAWPLGGLGITASGRVSVGPGRDGVPLSGPRCPPGDWGHPPCEVAEGSPGEAVNREAQSTARASSADGRPSRLCLRHPGSASSPGELGVRVAVAPPRAPRRLFRGGVSGPARLGAAGDGAGGRGAVGVWRPEACQRQKLWHFVEATR